MRNFSRHAGFTLVELLIGMTIFAIGLSAVYALLWSTLKNSTYSRHEIIAINLMREQIEMIKSGRDTAIKNFLPWDKSLIEKNGQMEQYLYSGTFIIEHTFISSGTEIDGVSGDIRSSPVRIVDIGDIPTDTGSLWQKSRLYLDDKGRYTYTITNT
jgi:prepilin-type N-terminal cleavage/methylation domain-containing protein